MKETKFRAWDRKNEKWLDDFLIDKNGEVWLWDTEGILGPQSGSWIKRVQFTGFRDKKGKEIYEGDIVLHDNEYWKVGWRELYGCWILLRSQTNKDDQLKSFQNDLLPRQVLVVGNIMENPEFLK